MIVSLLLCACACLALGSVPPSGFMTSLDIEAITNIQDTFLPMLEAAFTSITVPDVSIEDIDTPLGHAGFELSNIAIDVAHWGVTNVRFTPSGIHVSISGFSMKGVMDWHYHTRLLSDGGLADLTVDSVSIEFTLGIHDNGGKLLVDVPEIRVHIGEIGMDRLGVDS
ncbi:hypothetical protein KIPB_004189 [Kipferlia bialata]|uniref:Lipid-binding serum glycoprotein N-terminal domain-containing protein n=1 Tax=Kipferlia bialata TaxID=797122 RepID=A0A9K3CV20_9EUKA|nr:hypothetical protein KIPB_004189 [Kipferlia bialata]|eukprot:g4189.t1